MIVAIDTLCVLPGKVGAIERCTLNLIDALKRAGSPASRLVLLTRPENHALFSTFADLRTELIQLDRPTHKGKPITSWSDLLSKHPVGGRRALADFQRRKAAVLHQRRVDVVHFPGNTINPLDLDLPVVLNIHDLHHRHFPQHFTRDELDDREKWWVASAFRADAVLATTNCLREDLHQQFRVDRRKIFVSPAVLRTDSFARPPAGFLENLRDRFTLADKFFIYPADVQPHTNHDRLIRAFAAANIPGAQLVLTGSGQKRSNFGALIEELGAEFTVRLLGRVRDEDLVGLYHLATAVVFPTQHESWSGPVADAMACGCPIASSHAGGLPEEIGDAGLLFPPDDLDAMRDAMRQLAADAELRAALSQRGMERAGQFSPANFLRAISGAYDHARMNHRNRKAA